MNLFTIKDCLEIFIYRKPEQKLPIKLSVFVMSPNNCIHAKKSRKSRELTQTPINDHPHPSYTQNFIGMVLSHASRHSPR